MTGSIQVKKGRKNYFAVLNVYDDLGKRKLKWVDTGVLVAGNNKRAANKRLAEILVEYGEGGIDLTKDSDFADFMQSIQET